jgi:7-cyano-7-deazaguanine tRNA-ribosyltransferase
MNTTSTYHTIVQRKNGRVGELRLQRNGKVLPPLATPILYPVVSFMTGSTPRGGGLWKYLLRDLMKHDVPMLSQVLHFLDFPLKGKHLQKWRQKTMREWYQEVNGIYNAPLFLDSGGFKLLYNTGLDLKEFGIEKETEADDIFALQEDFGGEIIASLDYPLPPDLERSEAEQRMNLSLENACRVAALLTTKAQPPFLYVCCHGQSQSDIESYVRKVFDRLLGVLPSFGLAVGSLVPLRGKQDVAILERIYGVQKAIPDSERYHTPIHAFGVSGELTPILAYMGVDSFDSTSYIQAARGLSYSDPLTRSKRKLMELDELTCTCRICREVSLDEMQRTLMEEVSYKRTSTGKYKSECYASIALHNFELEAGLLSRMKNAIEADEALEELVHHASTGRRLRRVVDWLIENNKDFANRMAKTVVGISTSENRRTLKSNPYQLELFPAFSTKETDSALQKEQPTISLDYTPDSFSIPADYEPPQDKKILLVIPCAGKKPYSLSRTHTIINTKLQNAFGNNQRAIHKITLSGLYGPVPEEFESEEPVVRYDFQLSPRNTAQIQLGADRFKAYLDKHSDHYTLVVGYATSQAYRKVFERLQEHCSDFILLPIKPKQKRLSEFFRHVHLDELIEVLSTQIVPQN